jgi:DNA polymerase-1
MTLLCLIGSGRQGLLLAVSLILFVLSQLYNPSYSGGHSLEAWGNRLNHPKTEHEDFTCLTPEMLEYCANDTSLTALLFRKFAQRMLQFKLLPKLAQSLEHLAWNIVQNKQRKNGFPFNYEKAHELYVSLREREEELRKEIHVLWPPQPHGSRRI